MFRKTMTIGSTVALAAVGVLGATHGASAHEVQHVNGVRLAGTMDAPDSAWFGHRALWKAPSGEVSAKVASLLAAYKVQAAEAKTAGEAAQSAFEAWQVQAGEARAAAKALGDSDEGSDDAASPQAAYDEQKTQADEAWSAAKDARKAWLVQVREDRTALKAAWTQLAAERQEARDAKAQVAQKDRATRAHSKDSTTSVQVASWKTKSDDTKSDRDGRDGKRDGRCDHDGARQGDWSDRDGDHHGDRDGSRSGHDGDRRG